MLSIIQSNFRLSISSTLKRATTEPQYRRLWCAALAFAGATLLLASQSVADDAPVKSREEAQTLVSSLKPQKGDIPLRNGLATLHVPDEFRFFGPDDAQAIIVRLWRNPPGPKPLGMLLPANMTPLDLDSWAVIINYEEEGYVKDDDAGKIEYTSLLSQMQQSVRDANQEREKHGYPAMELIGWATPPHYDSSTHKLYWAKELAFAGQDEHELNYNIRILGRRGVLLLNAVAGMSKLAEVEKNTPQILSMVDFNEGHRYTDFDASTDKVATYGIAALVAGGVAAKLGFFKFLWVLLIGAKKFVIVMIAAIGAWLRRLFKRGDRPASPDQAVRGVSHTDQEPTGGGG